MNRHDAEKLVRSGVRLSCRGLYLLPEASRVSFNNAWHALTELGDLDGAVKLKEAVETMLKVPVLACATWDDVFRRVAGLIYGHAENCGYDFYNTMCLHPFDGQVRKYKCPQCGVEGEFQSPLIEVED